jgi:Na+/melibiose symporter-like transporter
MLNLNINSKEKKAFFLHTLSNVFEGVFDAVVTLNSVVLLKALLGSAFQVSVLFQIMILVFITSIFFNEYLKRVENKKKMLRVVALATRLPLMLFAFFPQNLTEQNFMLNVAFIGIFFIGFMARPIIFPTINLFLRNIYQEKNFGPLYAFSFQARKIVNLIALFLFGMLMDWDSSAYTYAYPIIGLITIIGIYIFSKVDYVSEKPVKSPLLKAVRNSYVNSFMVLKKDKPFRDFEIGYMIYGFAWLISYPVLAVYYVDALGLNYSGVAFYNNIFLIVSIFFYPFFGSLLERMDPRKYAMIVFAALGFFFVLAMATEYWNFHKEFFSIKFYPVLVIACLFHAIFTASQGILWNIGSSYFAKPSDSATYQSIHLTMVGLRAAFAPLIGVGLYKYFGFSVMFIVSAVLLAYSVYFVGNSAKKYSIKR